MTPTLDQLDPKEAWRPAPVDRWNLKWAAHLYRRAAFGVPPRREGEQDATSWDLLARAVKQGREASIEELLAGGSGQEAFAKLLDSLGQRFAAADNQLDKLQ